MKLQRSGLGDRMDDFAFEVVSQQEKKTPKSKSETEKTFKQSIPQNKNDRA